MKRNITKLFLTSALVLAFTASTLADGPGQAGQMSQPGQMGQPGQTGQPGQSSASSVSLSGATEIKSAASQSGKTYSSGTADENALLIDTSSAVRITNPTVTKTGNSSGGDNCSFYGQNAAVLVKGGSKTTISGGTVRSSANGANGIFSYGGNGGTNGASGDGTTVNISGTTIITSGNGSGGIMTTGGGVMNAENLKVTTSGGSSAPIRTDRGGGIVNVSGGTYTSNGLGSPAIYSTAAVSVKGATLISNLSEGVCIEGKNSVELTNCTLTANNTKTNGNATFLDTIMIYQSMSGDSDSGTSSFTMKGGTLNSKSGHVFHVTNTSGVINLSGVTINNSDNNNILLSVCDDGWSGGSNTAVLNASGQSLEGGILVGSDSSLTVSLSGNSSFTGYVSGNITNAKGSKVSSSVGNVSLTLDSTSKWTLTADSYVKSFSGNASNVVLNGHTLYVNGSAWNGTSSSSAASSGSASASKNETVSVDPAIQRTVASDTSIKLYWNEINSRTSAGKALLKNIKKVEVQYSTDKNFKNAVTKQVGKKKNKLTLTNLKEDQNYYVRLRYVGKKGTSEWSSTKKIKTK